MESELPTTAQVPNEAIAPKSGAGRLPARPTRGMSNSGGLGQGTGQGWEPPGGQQRSCSRGGGLDAAGTGSCLGGVKGLGGLSGACALTAQQPEKNLARTPAREGLVAPPALRVARVDNGGAAAGAVGAELAALAETARGEHLASLQGA